MNPQTHAEGASILGWLRPDRHPFYLITIACVLTITIAASFKDYHDNNWYYVFYLIAFILLINLVLSLFPQEIDNAEYQKNLKFARSLGMVSATLSLIVLLPTFAENTFPWVYSIIPVQIIVFSIYLFIAILKKNNSLIEGKKRINNFQLCITTSSLLFGIIGNYTLAHPSNSSIERHEYVYRLLFFCWLVCIFVWLYQLRGVFKLKINFDNPPD